MKNSGPPPCFSGIVYIILHSAEEDNLSPFDSNIACLCQSIEINNNKYVTDTNQKYPTTRQYITLATNFLAATKQLSEWFCPSVRPSVRPSHLFDYVPIIVSS